MSVIETFFNVTAVNTRRTTATPTSTDTIVTVSSIPGVLRPVTEVAKLFVENNIGKEFDYVAGTATNIRVGDDLHIGSSKYNVLGVAVFEDLEDYSDGYVNIRVARK